MQDILPLAAAASSSSSSSSSEKLWSDPCAVQPTIFILIKKLSPRQELWKRGIVGPPLRE